jgi:hypothetical protein
MHETAVSHGSEQEGEGKIKTQNARTQLTTFRHDGMTRTEGYVLKRTAILAERDFTFGAAVQIVEDCPRQSAARDGPKILDANYAGRRDCTRSCGHLRFQYPRFLKTGSYGTPGNERREKGKVYISICLSV